jgi:hypothetical protein
MATLNFDTLFEHELDGAIRDLVVTDKDGTPNRVIEKGAAWDVEVNWHVYGDPGVVALAGSWEISLRLESMGKGFEGEIANRTKNYIDVEASESTQSHRHWMVKFKDLGDPLPAEEEGVYLLVCLITYKDPFGHPAAMAGAIEGPLLTFYIAQP